MTELIGKYDTIKNYVPIGSLELKLAVARLEGYTIRVEETRYHHVVDGAVVTSVDESKPKYYYYSDDPKYQPNRLLPMLNPYRIAMEFYLREKNHE
jgi:hypothetical protein